MEALKGAYGFFCMTDYFAHRIEKLEDITEEAEGKQMAETAKSAGVTHFIYSTLPEVKERSGGKYKHVYHFDGKHRVEQYARTLGFEIDSYVAPSCYMQNFTGPVGHVVCSASMNGLMNRTKMELLYLLCLSQVWKRPSPFVILSMIWALPSRQFSILDPRRMGNYIHLSANSSRCTRYLHSG